MFGPAGVSQTHTSGSSSKYTAGKNNREMHLRVKATKQLNKYSVRTEEMEGARGCGTVFPRIHCEHGPPERQKEQERGTQGARSGDGSHSSRNRGYTTVPLGELAWFWDDNKPWKKEEKTFERRNIQEEKHHTDHTHDELATDFTSAHNTCSVTRKQALLHSLVNYTGSLLRQRLEPECST